MRALKESRGWRMVREGEGEGRVLLGERAGNWGNTLSTVGARKWGHKNLTPQSGGGRA